MGQIGQAVITAIASKLQRSRDPEIATLAKWALEQLGKGGAGSASDGEGPRGYTKPIPAAEVYRRR